MGRPILASQISWHLGDACKGIHAEARRSTATLGQSNGAPPHATPRHPTPQVPETHVPMRPRADKGLMGRYGAHGTHVLYRAHVPYKANGLYGDLWGP